RDQPVEIGERAEDRIDAAIVRDVVAEIGHGRGVERRDPDGIDAEPGQIVRAFDDAGEVADAVGVAVLEGARVDLIDDRALPPRALAGCHVRPRYTRPASNRRIGTTQRPQDRTAVRSWAFPRQGWAKS